MALKTWAPYERLLAGDLNTAYRYAAGEGAIVGAVSKVAGPVVAAPVANTRTEVQLGAPAAGSDPLGFYVPATKRMKCPIGYAGIYLLSASCNMTQAQAAASAAPAQWDLMGVAGLPGALALGTFHAFTTTAPLGISSQVILPMAEGEEWYLTVTSRINVGINAYVPTWALIRIAPYLGAIGS